MRIALAVALLAAPAAPAQAHPAYDYAGGCGLAMAGDGTDGPQTEWNGEVHAIVVATETVLGTPAAVPVTVECELRVGTTTRAAVAASGAGVAAGVVTFSFHADPDEVFTFCETVTVAGEAHQDCDDMTTIPLVPEPLEELLWELYPQALVDAVCESLAASSGGPLDQPPVFDTRSDGDTYVLGRLVMDCPPYGTSGS